jgi:hypothetical protein
VRRSRSLVRRIFCSSAYYCPQCDSYRYYYRTLFAMFQWYAYCPVCHNMELSRLRKADPIDRMTLNPLRRLLRFLGFPLYYCTFCRVQFGDLHPLHPALQARRSR